MQPLSVGEMRETLRRQGLQSLRKISDRNLQPRSGGNLPSSAETVENLKRSLRELEDERSAFLQEGVFDLVQFLCGHSQPGEAPKTSESSWAAQVISSVECLRQPRSGNLQEENRRLKSALAEISDSPTVETAKTIARAALCL